ncbi:hypothetical protein [Geomonas edaphica]|uniref:hypothetical protein n=1 Tax=Geomonas edaphica TaxID=2570226 RepID=UPI0010A86A76|nr:hypothetical protein [Geomonas edaphica]
MSSLPLTFDFRLLDVSLELRALEEHLQLIEKHTKQLIEEEDASFQYQVEEHNLTPEDAEWDFASQMRNHRIEFLFPRFRNPFLVALYSVFESAVTEIAQLIQRTRGLQITINDLRGNFLEKAQKYYNDILGFELYANEAWNQISMLSELRNAIAHTNGRIDMLKQENQKKIKKFVKQEIGIYSHYNFILVDEPCALRMCVSVREYVEDLIKRYKEWDDSIRPGSRRI